MHLKDIHFERVGISRRKVSYIIDLARKVKNESHFFKEIPYMNDIDIIRFLSEIRGIGRWSSKMFLIFCLNRLNILPLDDFGLKRAIMKYYELEELPTKDRILNIAQKWGSYRTIAVWYLWQSLNRNIII